MTQRGKGVEPVGGDADYITKSSGELFLLPDQYNELKWIRIALEQTIAGQCEAHTPLTATLNI